MKFLGRVTKVLGAKGLYITAAAGLAVMAGAGIIAYNKAASSVGQSFELNIPESSLTQQAEAKQENVKKPERDESSQAEEEVAPDESSSGKDKAPDVKYNTQPNVMPVIGEIINPFSGGELVKNATTGTWQTHNGTDIAAEVGADVMAAESGEITSVSNDPLWGVTVVLDHKNGYITKYCGLGADLAVQQGDSVNRGDVIGAVGETADIESTEAPHLHIEITHNGELIDPMTVFKA